MPQRHAAAFAQARREQRLKTLAVGDAGQRVLADQASQAVFQATTLVDIAQAAPKRVTGQGIAHQPVTDAGRPDQWFGLEQHHGRQQAGPGPGLQIRRGQQHGIALVSVAGTENVPVRAMQKYYVASWRGEAAAKQRLPEGLVRQKQQSQGFDRCRQSNFLSAKEKPVAALSQERDKYTYRASRRKCNKNRRIR